jgi:predicted transposase YdaD
MIDHDRLFKELLTTFFWEFIEFFLPEVAAYLERDSITFMDKEVFTDVTLGEKYEADLLVKARFQGKESFFVVHLEHQAQYQKTFPRRMFRYFSRLYEKHNLPVYPIALFSYSTPKDPEPNTHEVEFPNKVVLRFNYDTIQLNRLNWRDFLQQENPVATALMARMNIAKQDRRRVKYECLSLMSRLNLDPARMKMISGFIDTYLRLTPEEETLLEAEIATMEPTQREVIMQIVTSWMEKGLQQGRQEGKQEGKQEEALALILRQLTRRIGEVTPQLQERLSQLSLTQLEDLAEALLDFSTEENLLGWLQRASNESPQSE